MAEWPATLPSCFLRGKTRAPSTNIITFPTEVGPGKARRRSTANSQRMTLSALLTRDQLTVFEAFFQNDLKDGVLSFSMVDPADGSSRQWRFAPQDPYVLTERISGKWTLDMSVERLP